MERVDGIPVAAIDIGGQWPQEAEESFRRAIGLLPPRFRIARAGPVQREPDVIDAVTRSLSGSPVLLILAALHGATARSLALAAVRSGIPTAIWCHDAKHSLASSAIASETLRQLGAPHALIHGDAEAAARELEAVASAAAARQGLSAARIGQIGPLHPNILSAAVGPVAILRRFGAWIVPVSISSLRARAGSVEAGAADARVRALEDRYAVTADRAAMRAAAALEIALRGIARDERLDALAVDCWNEIVPGFGVAPCLGFAESEPLIACEGDPALAVLLLAGRHIAGGPGYAGDFYALDETDGAVTLLHCAGCAALHAGPERMEIGGQPPAGPPGTPGTVTACRPMLRHGPCTVALLHGERLDMLHLRRGTVVGTTVEPPLAVRLRLEGDPTCFRAEAAGNHYVVFPGDRVAAFRLWAEWAGTKVH